MRFQPPSSPARAHAHAPLPAPAPAIAWASAHARWQALLLATAALFAAGTARAVGSTVDVQVVERDTGRPLTVHHDAGSHYVAGRPGARYAIRVSNRTGGRVLAVMSVDGVNIVSGQTAASNQGGYVLGPWQTHEITGWRKSPHEVAAFEFTALPDSYAARTGRPLDVGVIGVAVFAERPVRVRMAPEVSREELRAQSEGSFDDQRGRYEARANAPAAKAAPRATTPDAAPVGAASPTPAATPEANRGAGSAADQDATVALGRRAAQDGDSKLGTGHGAREASHSSTTHFNRSSSRPVEVVSIQYDRFDNLVRAGVIDADRSAQPRPFPRSGSLGFVPDPPVW